MYFLSPFHLFEDELLPSAVFSFHVVDLFGLEINQLAICCSYSMIVDANLSSLSNRTQLV